jgi:LCP family protein required for cell wall assembly
VVGSDDDGQAGLHLIVPAITLILPLVMLALGLRAGPPASAPVPLLTASSPLTAAMARASADDAAAIDAQSELLDAQRAAADDLVGSGPPLAWATEVGATPIETPFPIVQTPGPTSEPPRPTAMPQPTWTGPRTFTFVALGVDQRNDDEIPRTDTIMIGKVDLSGPRVSLISVPRDLIVDIPGYGRDRINSAYVYGELYKEPGGGIGLLRQTIEKNFGVNVDHFGLVDFQCFRTTVDAVGGVRINVPKAIVDTQYPTDDYGIKTVKFDVGPQLMDGERALEYARTRHADSDFYRIQRQQLILAAVRDQVLRLRVLPALPTILSGCRNMHSDLGWLDYVNLASSFRALNGASVTFKSVDEQMVVDTILPSGAAVLLPRWEPIKSMFASTFGPPSTTATAGARPFASPGASPYPNPFASPFASPLASPMPSPSPLPMAPSDRVAGSPSGDMNVN